MNSFYFCSTIYYHASLCQNGVSSTLSWQTLYYETYQKQNQERKKKLYRWGFFVINDYLNSTHTNPPQPLIFSIMAFSILNVPIIIIQDSSRILHLTNLSSLSDIGIPLKKFGLSHWLWHCSKMNKCWRRQHSACWDSKCIC